MSTSTSHASDFELDSVDIKPVIVDAACFENSCLKNCVKPNSKDSGTQGKFVPICHNCGKIGHIRCCANFNTRKCTNRLQYSVLQVRDRSHEELCCEN